MDLVKIFELEEIKIGVYILKTIFIVSCTYFSIFRVINKVKFNKKLIVYLTITIIIISVICGIIKYTINSLLSTIFLILLLSLFLKKDLENIGYCIILVSLALSINYIIFFIAIIFNFTINIIINLNNDYMNLIIMEIIHILLLNKFFKIPKLKYGFSFIEKNTQNEYADILILNVSVGIIILFILLTNYNVIFIRSIFSVFILFIIIMFITIQKSIQLYYKQKLLIQDLEETKKELEEKKEEIKKLEQENLSFSKKSHSIAHKQKALEHKLNEILLLKTELGSETNIKEKIDKISEEISKNKPQVELSKTDIEQIDDMLKYMQSECIKNNIDFDLQIIGNIHQMTNNYISKEKLEILLADHIKNAIIAINYSDNINKSILVRLGKIDGFYSLYIYDSGIEFEINTLLNLGVKPSTTHKSSGGTGMGFMNTFDTVREYKASFILEEYGKPSKDDYTKAIMIKFDKKEDFKIISYRKEEIENEAKGKKLNFILNKRNNI